MHEVLILIPGIPGKLICRNQRYLIFADMCELVVLLRQQEIITKTNIFHLFAAIS